MIAGSLTEKVLIVGTSSVSWKLAELLTSLPLRHSFVVLMDNTCNTGGIVPRNGLTKNWQRHPFPVIGPIDRLENAIKDLRPDRIIVPHIQNGALPVEALLNSRMKGLLIEDGYEVYERLTGKLAIENLPPNLLIFSNDFNKPAYQKVLRRLYNLGLALVGLLPAGPLMAIIAIAIKLDSEGPLFFRQERVGLLGKPFRLIKFRTMRSAPGEAEETGWSRDVASRVTRVGTVLRRYRLDELPQFFNVLRGDMDVVGPRPEMACNVRMMSETIPYYSLRHMIRPGITGWAQVRNGYALTEEQVTEKIRYDLYYTKHASFWLDVRILFETVRFLLRTPGD